MKQNKLPVYSDKAYTPVILRISEQEDRRIYDGLLSSSNVFVLDEIEGQLRELIKSRKPTVRIKPEEYSNLIVEHLNGNDIESYGVWVYFPWTNKLVHLLDEEEFIEVRTNRNQYKITRDERDLLNIKKIGVVGLSVGQSIALTLAMERTCGELRLADFDFLELSNLNRIRAGVDSLGVSKVIVAAREIALIDPFLKVVVYPDGLHKDNMDDFFMGNGKLDLVVEVCDGLDIKIETRFKARSLGIPVVMDTNDRGMLDVERFDLQPDRPILHGLADGLSLENLKQLSNEEKIPYVLKMVGVDTISARMKASMLEVEQSITTWPQLASSVMLGGAITTDICRRILLDQYHDSGRYYIDFENLVADKKVESMQPINLQNPYLPLDEKLIAERAARYFESHPGIGESIPDTFVEKVIDAAIAAPSAGNNQPWKWARRNNYLLLFHDRFRSWSWGDHAEMGAQMAIGTAIENARLQAAVLGKNMQVQLFPMKEALPDLAAVIGFGDLEQHASPMDALLCSQIFVRNTNRRLGGKEILPELFYRQLQEIAESAGPVQLFHVQENDTLNKLGHIIAECDRIRLLNRQGHEEFYHEVRWNHEEAAATRDGIEIASADLSQSEVAGFEVAKDWNAISLLSQWKVGDGLKRMSIKTLQSASGMVLVTVPHFTKESLIQSGQAVERMWLYASAEKISLHPMLSPIFFLNKIEHGDMDGLTAENIALLNEIGKEFRHLFGIQEGQFAGRAMTFLMKLSKAEPITVKSFRKMKSEVFMDFDK